MGTIALDKEKEMNTESMSEPKFSPHDFGDRRFMFPVITHSMDVNWRTRHLLSFIGIELTVYCRLYSGKKAVCSAILVFTEFAMSNMTKGVLPDGAKIRKLRRQAGKTQKGLINNTVVMLRTLQRAEQGKPILPDMLGAIAASLGVTSNELRKGASTDDSKSRPIVRLRRMAPPSASNFIKHVRDGVDRMDIEFDLDPDQSTAELLAEAAELLEEFRANWHWEFWWAATSKSEGLQENKFTPAQEIRKIGRLNTLLQSLADSGIFPYLGTSIEWILDIGMTSSSAGAFNVHVPYTIRVMAVRFSTDPANYVIKNIADHSWEQIEKKAIYWNKMLGVPPDYIEQKLDLYPVYADENEKRAEFLENYKKVVNDQHSSEDKMSKGKDAPATSFTNSF